MKLVIDYKETFDDSDWMTSGTDYEHKQEVKISSKEELINFLTDIQVHKEVIKEVQEEPLNFELPLDHYFSHNETSGYYSQDFRLSVVSKKTLV